MYRIKVLYLTALCVLLLLTMNACGSESTVAQEPDTTNQNPTAEPTMTPVQPTPKPPTPTATPTTTPTPFDNFLAYELPGMEQVEVRIFEYRQVDGQPYYMDVYYPPQMAPDERLPVVIFVQGFPKEAFIKLNGVPHREFGGYTSWGRLVAAAGMVGVLYDSDLWDDLDYVVQYIQENHDALNMDPDRIGLWSNSGTSLTASSFAMQAEHDFLNFAVFYYGVMLTPDNFRLAEIQGVCQDAGCYVPNSDDQATSLPEVDEIRTDLPLLIARAGKDNFVNGFIDHFAEQATAAGAQLTLLDHPEGVHGFDGEQNDERTIEIIVETLAFMSANFTQQQ